MSCHEEEAFVELLSLLGLKEGDDYHRNYNWNASNLSIDFAFEYASPPVAIDLYGYYWHTHPRQIRRDLRKAISLRQNGWAYYVIWDHELEEFTELLRALNVHFDKYITDPIMPKNRMVLFACLAWWKNFYSGKLPREKAEEPKDMMKEGLVEDLRNSLCNAGLASLSLLKTSSAVDKLAQPSLPGLQRRERREVEELLAKRKVSDAVNLLNYYLFLKWWKTPPDPTLVNVNMPEEWKEPWAYYLRIENDIVFLNCLKEEGISPKEIMSDDPDIPEDIIRFFGFSEI